MDVRSCNKVSTSICFDLCIFLTVVISHHCSVTQTSQGEGRDWSIRVGIPRTGSLHLTNFTYQWGGQLGLKLYFSRSCEKLTTETPNRVETRKELTPLEITQALGKEDSLVSWMDSIKSFCTRLLELFQLFPAICDCRLWIILTDPQTSLSSLKKYLAETIYFSQCANQPSCEKMSAIWNAKARCFKKLKTNLLFFFCRKNLTISFWILTINDEEGPMTSFNTILWIGVCT